MENIEENIATYLDLKAMMKSDEYRHLGIYNYSKLCKLQKSELKMKMQKLTKN